MPTTTLKISGMNCGSCVAHVEKALKAVPGVDTVAVDLPGKRATVQHTGVSSVTLQEAVIAEGYGVKAEE